MILFTATPAAPPRTTTHYFRPPTHRYYRHHHLDHQPTTSSCYSLYDILRHDDDDYLMAPAHCQQRSYCYGTVGTRRPSFLAQPTAATRLYYPQHSSRRCTEDCCDTPTPAYPSAYYYQPMLPTPHQHTSGTSTRRNPPCCSHATRNETTAAADLATIIDDIFSWWPINVTDSYHRHHHPRTAARFTDRGDDDNEEGPTPPLSYATPHEMLAALFGSTTDSGDGSSSQHPNTHQQTAGGTQATSPPQRPQAAGSGAPASSASRGGDAHQHTTNKTKPQSCTRPHAVIPTRQASPISVGHTTETGTPPAHTPVATSPATPHRATAPLQATQTHTPESPLNQHTERSEPTSPLSLLWPFLTDDERQLLGLSPGTHNQRRGHTRHHHRHSQQQQDSQHQAADPQPSDRHAESQSPLRHREEVLQPHSDGTPATVAGSSSMQPINSPTEGAPKCTSSPVSADDKANSTPTPPKLTVSSTHVTTVIGPDGVPVSQRVYKFTDSDGQVKTLRTRSIGADTVTDGDAENTRGHKVSTEAHDLLSDAAVSASGKLSLEDFEKRWAMTALGSADAKKSTAAEGGGDDADELAASAPHTQASQHQIESPLGEEQQADGTMLKTSSAATA